MKLLEVPSSFSNPLVANYINHKKEVSSFFDYPKVYHQHTYEQRLQDLHNRTYKREDLVTYLTEFHKNYAVHANTIANIQKLKDQKSVVVIGGQQAGLLTGPLYTIHKIISIITFAKMQEQSLHVPVLPVFWIAGEDHDFAEINHTFVYQNGKMKKITIAQKEHPKKPVSSIRIDKQIAKTWIKDIVSTYEETLHTKELFQHLLQDLELSTTYVDFFIRLIFRLFPDQGLIVVDSGDEGFRKLGSPFMQMLIQHNEKLGKNVLYNQLALKEMGYGEPIDIYEQNAHLFYIYKGERIRLEREGCQYIGKHHECNFTQEELLHLVRQKPHLFSNNVVTRPLLQEYLFPTLAFISGPGEVLYWAALRKAFHLFQLKMPPVLPRLMITIIDRKANKYIKEKGFDLQQLLVSGCQKEKEKWLFDHQVLPIETETESVLQNIMTAHKSLRDLAVNIDPSLQELAEKNAELIRKQVLYLRHKMEQTVLDKQQVELAKFDYVHHAIRPFGAPQERIWNIFYFLNLYGYSFIEQLLNVDFTWNEFHKVVFI